MSAPQADGPRRRSLPALPTVLAFTMSAVLFACFCYQAFRAYSRVDLSWDTAIYDQAVWLMSRGETPFVTLRGILIVADHWEPVLWLLAPLYWLVSDVRVLLIVQAAAVAAGTGGVYLLGKRVTGSDWFGFVFAAVYSLYPPLHYAVREGFHPVTLCIPLVLWLHLLLLPAEATGADTDGDCPALARRVPIVLLLTLATNERLGALVGLWLLLVAAKRRSRALAFLAVIGIAWSVTAVTLVLPHFSPSGTWCYQGLFSQYGRSWGEVLQAFAESPALLYRVLFADRAVLYYLQMLLPLGLLSLAGGAAVVPGLLALVANAAAPGPAGTVFSHHAALPVPFLFAGALLGVQRIMSWVRTRAGTGNARCHLVQAGIVTYLVAFNLWPVVALFLGSRGQYRVTSPTSVRRIEAAWEALSLIPEGASVSAQVGFTSHLAHRKEVFTFPAPFVRLCWGDYSQQSGAEKWSDLHPDELAVRVRDRSVQYVILEENAFHYPLNQHEFAHLVRILRSSPEYTCAFDRQGVLLFARRIPSRR